MDPLVMNWYWLAVAMSICFITCIMLMTIQRSAFKWYSKLKNDDSIFKKKQEHFCLYGAYITASICSVQCLLNHISNHLPELYCVYGMSICVIFHEAAKTFGYGFFLERAKASIISTKSEILPPVMTKYILPIYIASYFVLYCILCPLTFRGLSVNPNHLTSIPTACLFDRYQSWIFYLSVGVEVFNSIFFVFVFVQPLYTIINSEQVEVIKIIKYNIVFSSVACISSVIFLFYRALSRNTKLSHYLWLAANVDLVINALCIFIMVTVNRKYLYFTYLKHCKKCTCISKSSDDLCNEKTKVTYSCVVPINTKNDKTENRKGNSRHHSIEQVYSFRQKQPVLHNENTHIISETAKNQTMTFSKNRLQYEAVPLNESKTSIDSNIIPITYLPSSNLADLREATPFNLSMTFPNLSSRF